MTEVSAYERLIGLLDENGARYHLIDHEPEGRTEVVSRMRGNEPSEAAKCIVVMVKITKKHKRYILAVVPGDARVDLEALKTLFEGTYAGFASGEVAERLAGSVAGTILPFSSDPELGPWVATERKRTLAMQPLTGEGSNTSLSAALGPRSAVRLRPMHAASSTVLLSRCRR